MEYINDCVAGGSDSERTFVKQVIQKHMATEDQDIFNIDENK